MGCGMWELGDFRVAQKNNAKKNQYKSLISNRSFAEPNTKKKRN